MTRLLADLIFSASTHKPETSARHGKAWKCDTLLLSVEVCLEERRLTSAGNLTLQRDSLVVQISTDTSKNVVTVQL